MKEKLLPIQIQLLDRLNRTKEPVSSQFLANSLGVSSKTIRKNLSQLNLALSDQGAAIASKTGSGYWLIIEDRERFEQLCRTHPFALRSISSIRFRLTARISLSARCSAGRITPALRSWKICFS